MTDASEGTSGSRRFKRWVKLGTVAVAGLAMASASMAATRSCDTVLIKAKTPASGLTAANEGGEGGEGMRDGSVEAEALYLVVIGRLEGQLRTAMALYDAGKADLAGSIIETSAMAVYADLKPKLADREAASFDDQMASFAAAIDCGKPPAVVAAAFGDVSKALAAARNTAGGGDFARLLSAAMLIRQAGADFATSVKDGAVVNPGVYQGAWGYYQAARIQVQPLITDSDSVVAAAATRIDSVLDDLKPAFPAPVPEGTIKADANLIYGAGARIILAAQTVK